MIGTKTDTPETHLREVYKNARREWTFYVTADAPVGGQRKSGVIVLHVHGVSPEDWETAPGACRGKGRHFLFDLPYRVELPDTGKVAGKVIARMVGLEVESVALGRYGLGVAERKIIEGLVNATVQPPEPHLWLN